MLKNLGPHAFGFGYPVPVLLVATYNDDGTVNVMNLHEAMRTNAGDLALCIGPRSKTHANVEKRRAFTVALVNQNLLAEVDYWGSVSGRDIPDKFARTGAVAVKSQFVNAPIIQGSPLVIECQLIEIAWGTNFSTVLAKIVNVAADTSVLGPDGRVDSLKTGMLLYDPFGTSYVSLGQRVGTAWGEGRKFL
ncbi:MAG TPA: flavin reductase [Candidatus Evtepia faecigallinarum]|nr:flavin reductase [Candidatus Evtepia faecigallinarum]